MLFPATKNKTLALAGLAQSGKIITQLASEDSHDESALRESARSLLLIDAQDVNEIFNGAQGVNLGLQTIQTLLKGQGFQSQNAKELIRYLLSMDQLATRLATSASTQTIIHEGLAEINASFIGISDGDASDMLDSEYDAFYARIGTLYQKSLSQLPPKIIVRGAKGKLQSERSVARVRTALFAGVRAAYLWHQQGSRRWHLLFSRKQYAQLAQKISYNRVE